jgi:hypothetical protein
MLPSRVLGVLLTGLSLFGAPLARADATADVKDIRAGNFPLRHEWLGWDAAGHAHVRTLVCSTGGTDSCHAALLDLAPDGTTHATKLLDVVEVYCGSNGPCAALDAKTVSDFVVADKRAVAALPSLTRTTVAADPKSILGMVAGEPTRIEVASFDVATSPDDVPHLAVRVVARGKGGAFEVLGTLDERAYTVDSAAFDTAYVSPDGKSAVVVARSDTTMMCWSFQELGAFAVNLPRRRASLANTIGFRAWKKGDMPAALAAFTEATHDDPDYALGWYNRAAVESRTGATKEAATSFRRAIGLDASLSARACKDRDLDALRAQEPATLTCP